MQSDNVQRRLLAFPDRSGMNVFGPSLPLHNPRPDLDLASRALLAKNNTSMFDPSGFLHSACKIQGCSSLFGIFYAPSIIMGTTTETWWWCWRGSFSTPRLAIMPKMESMETMSVGVVVHASRSARIIRME